MVQTIYRPYTMNGKTPSVTSKIGKVATGDVQVATNAADFSKVGKQQGLGRDIQKKIIDLDLVEKDRKAEKRKKVKPITFEMRK